MREKHYDSIVIKEILHRANVGRSTFYAHFRDKDDLLVNGIHDMLRAAVPTDGRTDACAPHDWLLWFSLPIFEYHDRHRRAGGAKMGVKGRAVLHEHLRRVLADLVANDVTHPRGRRTSVAIPPAVLAQYVASTFILVLNWWIESRSPLTGRDVDALFRALVRPTLTTIWE